MRNILRQSKLFAVAIALVVANLGFVGDAMGQTNTWDGSSSNQWTTGANWSLNHQPTSGEDVIIPNSSGYTTAPRLNGNISVTIKSLQVGGGTDGTLQYDRSATQSITVTNNVTVSSGATFSVRTGGSGGTCTLSVGGNLVNNGTIDFVDLSLVNTTFNGAGNQTVSGSGGTTDFNLITINNSGASGSNIVEVSSSNFTAPAGFLTLTDGILKLSGSYTFSNTFITPAGHTIPAGTGIWLNNSNVTVTGQNGTVTLNGSIQISNGIYNIGTGTGNSLIYSSGSTITVDGGSLNIAGRLSGTSSTQTTTFNMSAGTITVNTVGTSNALASFDVSASGSSFTTSGGTIVIQEANAGAGGDFRNIASTTSITGGTVQFGNSSTPSTDDDFDISGTSTIPSITIVDNATSVPTVTVASTLVIKGDVTINNGTSFLANNQSITVSGNSTSNPGNWTNNGGTFTPGTSTINFNNTSADQNVNGSATTQVFNNLTVAKSSNKLVIGGSTTTLRVTGTLDMTSGNIDCGTNTLELGSSTSVVGTLTYTNGNIIGKFKRWFDATGAKRFPLGTSAGSGTATANRNALVTFTNLTNGSLTGSFIATDPGTTGLPLTESSLTIGSQFTEGYWSLVAANSLASTNYALELTGQGFSSQTQDATVRIIKRPDGGGNWTLNGTHVAAASGVAKRSGLSGFSEFAHAAVCPNPTIDVPPASVTKCAGESASFSVTATGPGALTYQWYKSPSTLLTNGGAISGATTATLTINPVAVADNGSSYYVVVTRTCGSTASSSAATLTVNPLPTITLGANPAVCQGITSANLPYSATTNGANQYSINYNTAAETAGFMDVSNLSLPTTPIVLTVPSGAAPAVYNADLTVRNSVTGCVSSVTAITITVWERPTAGTCNQTDDYCYTNAGHIDIKASGGLAPYSVTWSPVHGMSQPATITNSGDILTVTGLHAATVYTFVVTDAHGCTAQ